MIYIWTEDQARQVADDEWELEDRIHNTVIGTKNKYFRFLYSEAHNGFDTDIGVFKNFDKERQENYKEIKYNEIKPYAKDIFRVIFK